MKSCMEYAGVILQEEGNKFLLQLREDRTDILKPNKWAIFGGGVKENETPLTAAIREIKEELDLDLNKKNVIKLITVFFPGKKYHIYKADIKRNLSSLKLNEGSDMKLFSREEIIKTKGVLLSIKLFFLFNLYEKYIKREEKILESKNEHAIKK